MAPLTKRQETAEALCRELQRIGAHVVNAMPLNDDHRLRFQILNDDREAVLQKLGEWGWSPILRNHGLRLCLNGVAEPCTTYEIDIPRERQPIPQDRTIRGEIVEKPAQTADERAAVKKHLGFS
jgi:hypothetical protein